MTEEIERELKTLLTRTQYEQILTNYELSRSYSQTNYYFDTADFVLHQHGIGLRIRKFADTNKIVQTLKVNRAKSSSRRELTEITDTITAAELTQHLASNQVTPFSGTVGEYLNQAFPQQPIQLIPIATAATKRTLLRGPETVTITLDTTAYADGFSDYELEVEELDDKKRKSTFELLLKKFHISKHAVENKRDRALKHR